MVVVVVAVVVIMVVTLNEEVNQKHYDVIITISIFHQSMLMLSFTAVVLVPCRLQGS